MNKNAGLSKYTPTFTIYQFEEYGEYAGGTCLSLKLYR